MASWFAKLTAAAQALGVAVTPCMDVPALHDGNYGGNGYRVKGTCAKASKAAAEVPSEVPSAPPSS